MTAAPCNPNASPKTRALLRFFHSLPERTEQKVVSGHAQALPERRPAGMADIGLSELESIHRKTGRWVGMIAGEYCDFYGVETPAQKESLKHGARFLADVFGA